MRAEDAAREAEVRGEWGVPAGVTIAPGVPLDASDPARISDTRRQCIAAVRTGARAGERCAVNAIAGTLVCSAHAGRLDSSAGGRAKAAKSLALKMEAEERLITAAMGARAAIRAEVLERADQLRRIIAKLMDDAEAGNSRAQQTLAIYLTQGFGSPQVAAGETAPPDDATHLATLSDDDLRKLAFPSSQEA